VYFVQNGRAQELAQIVGEALSAEVVKTEEVAPEARLAPGLAPAELTSPGGTPVMGSDAGAETGGSDTLSNTYGTSQPLQRLHPTAGDQGGLPDIGISGGTEAPKTGFKIVADARNNALLVHATAEEYELVSAALEKLDIVPLQVFIEATIAEVTLNDTLKYGLEWFFDLGNSTVSFNTTTTKPPAPQPNLILSQFPGFSWLYATDDVRIVLNALSQITDLKVISSPTLLVLDNEPARLQVGDQVPISVRSSTSVTDPEAPTVNEIEYRDTGVILDIIPRVNSNGMVVLDIIQEVSDVVPSTANATDTQTITPTIAQRRIASTVSVSSGETVALGGLIRDTSSEGVTGVPLLSDIPILGNLFKTTTDVSRRTELLVLLTPRVVRDPNDARTVTDELRKRLRAVDGLPQLIQ
jgi:general secretion pathway protein D